MRYISNPDHGRQLEIENNGDQTFLALSSSGLGQQQSQSSGFHTGRWTKPPSLFRLHDEFIIQINAEAGTRFLRVAGNQVGFIDPSPDLKESESVPLREAPASAPRESMKPMEPMRPMEPMKPMKPMEMRMGNMSMKMGGKEEGTRFCTQCGNALGAGDRFCGKCGHSAGS